MSELARLHSKPSPQETTPEKHLLLLPSGLLLAGNEAWPQIHLAFVLGQCCGYGGSVQQGGSEHSPRDPGHMTFVLRKLK